jgi:hypothetical protein
MHAAIQMLRARVDSGEHRRNREKLERTAHRETLVRAVRHRPAALGIVGKDAETAAGRAFYLREGILRCIGTQSVHGKKRAGKRRGPGEKIVSSHHALA